MLILSVEKFAGDMKKVKKLSELVLIVILHNHIFHNENQSYLLLSLIIFVLRNMNVNDKQLSKTVKSAFSIHLNRDSEIDT